MTPTYNDYKKINLLFQIQVDKMCLLILVLNESLGYGQTPPTLYPADINITTQPFKTNVFVRISDAILDSYCS